MRLTRLGGCCWTAAFLLPVVVGVSGQTAGVSGRDATADDPALQAVLDRAVQETFTRFAAQNLKPDELAVTLFDLRDSGRIGRAHYRGDVQVYPASVIKLFYLVAAQQWMEDGKLEDTAELRRAMRDMIVDSYNEPTHYVVDLLTDTTSGPELSPEALEVWYGKRNAVNRYFQSLGYEKVNANRKPWCEGPYGREMQSVKAHAPNHRNLLTTDETARLLAEVATGRAVSVVRSREMMALLKRDPFRKTAGADQGNDYTGRALPPDSKLWSKAGWTSRVRHDAAYVELPGGGRFVLVTFTENHSSEREIIPFLAGKVCESFQTAK